MSKNKKLISVIIAVFLVVFGLVFGVYWNSEKFCIGDIVFRSLGLPVWSKGTTGLHYPAVLGVLLLTAGVFMLNFSFKKRIGTVVWTILILISIILSLVR